MKLGVFISWASQHQLAPRETLIAFKHAETSQRPSVPRELERGEWEDQLDTFVTNQARSGQTPA